MGKAHDDWKAAKAKAKLIDTKALFKKNLGDALDKWEAAWAKVKPAVDAKLNAKTLTLAECNAFIKAIEPYVDKVGKTFIAYQDLIMKTELPKLKKKTTTDPKEKQKLKDMISQLADLYKALGAINDLVIAECWTWIKGKRGLLD